MSRPKKAVRKMQISPTCPYCGKYHNSIVIKTLTKSFKCLGCERLFWLELQVNVSPFSHLRTVQTVDSPSCSPILL